MDLIYGLDLWIPFTDSIYGFDLHDLRIRFMVRLTDSIYGSTYGFDLWIRCTDSIYGFDLRIRFIDLIYGFDL